MLLNSTVMKTKHYCAQKSHCTTPPRRDSETADARKDERKRSSPSTPETMLAADLPHRSFAQEIRRPGWQRNVRETAGLTKQGRHQSGVRQGEAPKSGTRMIRSVRRAVIDIQVGEQLLPAIQFVYGKLSRWPRRIWSRRGHRDIAHSTEFWRLVDF